MLLLTLWLSHIAKTMSGATCSENNNNKCNNSINQVSNENRAIAIVYLQLPFEIDHCKMFYSAAKLNRVRILHPFCTRLDFLIVCGQRSDIMAFVHAMKVLDIVTDHSFERYRGSVATEP